MTMEEQRKIFATNLKVLIEERGLKQNEVAKAIGVSRQTLNNWIVEISLPRMNKVQALANFFGVPKSALIDPPVEETRVARLVRVFEARPELWRLLDLVDGMNSEDLNRALAVIEALKGVRHD